MTKPTQRTRKKTNGNDGSPHARARAEDVLTLDIENTGHLADLYGSHDRHLALIEDAFDVYVAARGNRLTFQGSREACRMAAAVIRELAARLERGLTVGEGEVLAACRMALDRENGGGAPSTSEEKYQIRTKKRVISPRSPNQAAYIEALRTHDLTFGLGPAGTGKTYLAVAVGTAMMLRGEVERLVLSRPAVEAGERLGFLPGDMREKVDPYLRPLYDALHDMLPAEQVVKKLENGDIEVAPLAFMRGRTLNQSFVILDEAQNCTPMQIKMFLTRLGENSRMVVTGDPSQEDLSEVGMRGLVSGLPGAVKILEHVDGVAVTRFSQADVVRHPLVARIVSAYEDHKNA